MSGDEVTLSHDKVVDAIFRDPSRKYTGESGPRRTRWSTARTTEDRRGEGGRRDENARAAGAGSRQGGSDRRPEADPRAAQARLHGPNEGRHDNAEASRDRPCSGEAARGVGGGARRQPAPGDPDITPALVDDTVSRRRSTRSWWRCWDGNRLHRARHVQRALVGALRLQELPPAAQDAPQRGALRPARPGRKRRRRSTSAMAWASRSRSSRTTIRRRSSPTRARRPASAASCATSSRWARGRSRCSIRSASARSTRPRVRYLFDGVVQGIGDYGNCVGIPTVGGEVFFDPSYAGNPLVNAMCVGVVRKDELMSAVAEGVGNPLIAVGARTGRDGIHGATFASRGTLRAERRQAPAVQVGDPFTEKLLLEASLELIQSGAIVGIQDMGAAGLTSSSAEMAARGDVGVTIDVTKVPVRETGMTPYEILLSESQERMLVVAKRGREDEVAAISREMGAHCRRDRQGHRRPVYRVTEGDRVVADSRARDSSRTARRTRPTRGRAPRSRRSRAGRERHAERPEERDPLWTLEHCSSSPTIASKRGSSGSTTRPCARTRSSARAATRRWCACAAPKALALKTDCNGRYAYLDPRVGGADRRRARRRATSPAPARGRRRSRTA